MAHQVSYSEELVNALADAHGAKLNNGYIRIYGGTIPTNVDTAIGSQVMLAQPRFGSPAFAAASGGIARANTIADDTSAAATGIPTWYRTFKSDGTSAISQGTAGLSGCDLNLADLDPVTFTITLGSTVRISGYVYTAPKS